MIQELTSDDSGVSVTTRIAHKSGEWVEFGPFFMPVTKHDAHGFGSAVSYARRYALSAAAGTVADDDDGNAAVQSKPIATATPDGFTEWWDDMVSVADEGLPALEAAFKQTKRADLKAFAVKERREKWANLKKHAASAKPAVERNALDSY